MIFIIRRLLKKLMIRKRNSTISSKPNPYTLVYWRSDWSKNKTMRNNAKYWDFEIRNNGLRLP
jgi:hypothetical protein